jgi:transcriptional regulator with XRE-family HTH domain
MPTRTQTRTGQPVDPIAVLLQMQAKVGTRRALAAQLGLSGAYLSDIMNGRRDVNARLLDKLGLMRVVVQK